MLIDDQFDQQVTTALFFQGLTPKFLRNSKYEYNFSGTYRQNLMLIWWKQMSALTDVRGVNFFREIQFSRSTIRPVCAPPWTLVATFIASVQFSGKGLKKVDFDRFWLLFLLKMIYKNRQVLTREQTKSRFRSCTSEGWRRRRGWECTTTREESQTGST